MSGGGRSNCRGTRALWSPKRTGVHPPHDRIQGSTVRNSGGGLDDTEFVDCRFERCHIVYRGGAVPRFNNVTFVECEFAFDGAAGNTFECVRMLYQFGKHGPIVGLLESLNMSPVPPPPKPPPN